MKATREQMQAEALSRVESGQSMANFVSIFEGFMAKGIPLEDIRPRENVFTYNAWRAKGRQVRRGEHGVKVVTFIPVQRAGGERSDGESEERKDQRGYSRPWTATVFHISQTDLVDTRAR
jgi:hypothetical protein